MRELRPAAAFGACALLVAAVLVLLLAEGGPPPREPAVDRPQRATVRGGASPAQARARRQARRQAQRRAAANHAAREDLPRHDHRPPPARGTQRQVALGRSFVAALFRHERGMAKVRTRRELRRRATPALTRRVLSAPPRQPEATARPPAGRIVAVEPVQIEARRAELLASVERGGRRTGLLLELVRVRGRWLVANLR